MGDGRHEEKNETGNEMRGGEKREKKGEKTTNQNKINLIIPNGGSSVQNISK